MTVQELIERLRGFPPNAEVMSRDYDGELVRVDDVDLLPVHWLTGRERTDGERRVYITGNY